MEFSILQYLKGKGGEVEEKKLKKQMVSEFIESNSVEKDVAKKTFKKALASLIDASKVKSVDDVVKVVEETATKKRKAVDADVAITSASKSSKKGAKGSSDAGSGELIEKELWKNGEQYWRDGTLSQEYLRTNPDKVTRLFCGNLNKKVTEEELKNCIDGITYIKWITDRESGEFYGTSYLEMKDPAAAAVAVAQDKSKFMGRPLKIYYCPSRPGDKWPPVGGKSSMKGGGGSAAAPPRREATPKPDGCKKMYAGNLSYNIDDDTMVDFFKDCGEIVGLRWLTHQSSGEFRGCGFVEFRNTEDADKAIKLNGKELLGRPIILDWTN